MAFLSYATTAKGISFGPATKKETARLMRMTCRRFTHRCDRPGRRGVNPSKLARTCPIRLVARVPHASVASFLSQNATASLTDGKRKPHSLRFRLVGPDSLSDGCFSAQTTTRGNERNGNVPSHSSSGAGDDDDLRAKGNLLTSTTPIGRDDDVYL